MDIVAPTALSGMFAAWILQLGVSGPRQSTRVNAVTKQLLDLIGRHASEGTDWADVFDEFGTSSWARGWHDAVGVTRTIAPDFEARRLIRGLRTSWETDGNYQLTEIARRAQVMGDEVIWAFPVGRLRVRCSPIS
ncbi:hypothetical protein [Herbiconiux ginsengi]|uniref:hypothetical protein n=1 Tax=Herbiconiux ginsengi TaxID=381665 RepID=UPI001114D72C|nr:hypothetical protein [Herbiconiux ginsengi]